MDYLSGLKNKSVLPLKNLSFIIKSTAPSNIKCLKNVVLTSPCVFLFFSPFIKKEKTSEYVFTKYKEKTMVSIKNLSFMHKKCDNLSMDLFC